MSGLQCHCLGSGGGESFLARPGFVSLRLHPAVNDDAPYRWVNALGWSEFPSKPALFEVDTEGRTAGRPVAYSMRTDGSMALSA